MRHFDAFFDRSLEPAERPGIDRADRDPAGGKCRVWYREPIALVEHEDPGDSLETEVDQQLFGRVDVLASAWVRGVDDVKQ